MLLAPSPRPMQHPDDLPDRWWDRPEAEVATLIAPVRWPSSAQGHWAGRDLERLLRHHPSLVSTALHQGIDANASWQPPSIHEPGMRHPAQRHSALWYAFRLSTPEAVRALMARGAELSSDERAELGGLPMAMLHQSRNPPSDSPLMGLNEDARWARENELIRLLADRGHPLGEDDPGAVMQRAARRNRPDNTVRALMEHGADLNGSSSSGQTALREVIVQGHPENLNRWLNLGTALSHGPGDDRYAMAVVMQALRRDDETRPAWAHRQAALLDVLNRHGWTPGPRFRAIAVLMSVHQGNDPALLPHLIAWGARPDTVNARGQTALHLCFHMPQGLDNVPALLALGADPMACDVNGRTAIDQARQSMSPFPGARPAYDAVIVAMETAVLRRAAAPTPSDPSGLDRRRPATAPRARL